jgi:hypothetical protein
MYGIIEKDIQKKRKEAKKLWKEVDPKEYQVKAIIFIH